MKSVKEILVDKTVPILVHICKIFGLRGYSNLKKEGIIQLISENVENPQFQESLQYLIPNNGTAAFILNACVANKNEISYEILRKEVLLNRSGSSFREVYRVLLSKYILFESEESDDDKVFLPKEFTNTAKKLITRKLKVEEPEEEGTIAEQDIESKKQEKIPITKIEHLLHSRKYTTVENLQNLLMSLDLKISGTKAQLIERVLYEAHESLENLLNYIFGKNELKDICRDFELPVSGKKEELITRILDKLPPEFPDKISKEKKVSEEKTSLLPSQEANEGKGMASGQVESQIPQAVEPTLRPKKINLLNEFYKFLKDLELDYRTIHNVESLAGQIFSIIHNMKLMKDEFKDIEINRDAKEQVISIKNAEDNIAIFVWYFHKKRAPISQKQKISYNIVTYRATYSEKLICYIYDPAGKLPQEEIDNYEKLAKIICKTERQFKE